MQENKLIKYDNWQLRKVDNLIALTNKILLSEDREEIKISPEVDNDEGTDKRILAMIAMKKFVMKARAWKAEKLAQELKSQNKTKTFDEKIDNAAE